MSTDVAAPAAGPSVAERPNMIVVTVDDLGIPSSNDMGTVAHGAKSDLGAPLPKPDEPHPDSPRRPASDREIVATILAGIDAALQ